MLFKVSVLTAITSLVSSQGFDNSTSCNYGDAALVPAGSNVTTLCCPAPSPGYCYVRQASNGVIMSCFYGQDGTPNIPYTFNVPQGLTSVFVNLEGEDGHTEQYNVGTSNPSQGPGGAASYVYGPLDVTAFNGTTLSIFVGALGGAGGAASSGFNGTVNTNQTSGSYQAGANGGGFTSVGSCSSPNAGPSDCRLAVAAGGGGAGTAILYTGYGGQADKPSGANGAATGSGAYGSLGSSFGGQGAAGGGGGGAGLYGGQGGIAPAFGGGGAGGGAGGLSYFPGALALQSTNTTFRVGGYVSGSATFTYVATNCVSPIAEAAARLNAAVVVLISNQAFNAVTTINCPAAKINRSTDRWTCNA